MPVPEEPISLAAASQALERGQISACELLEQTLARADGAAPLNCFIRVLADSALEEAKAADARIARGERRGPLDGIPLAVKDNIDVAGVPATAGMALRAAYIPAQDAFVVQKLRQAGAVIAAKANLHEAALGATNDNPHFGRCFNPHGENRTPGGSSGGSAAAVAAGLVYGAIGTDTIGSVRIPASYCGVVGVKPTYGLVSTRGVLPASWRLDHVGPIARTVEDAGLLLEAMAGYDLACPESRLVAPWAERTFRLGVLENYRRTDVQAAVQSAFERALTRLEALGYRIGPVAIEGYDPGQVRRRGLLMLEADAALVHEADLGGRPGRFGADTRAMLEFGRNAPAVKLARAERVVALAATAVQRLLEGLDAIVSPTTPQTAFRFDEPVPPNQGDLTALANFAGCPAISLPVGGDADGMPIGLQLMGPAGSERRLLEIARSLEQAGL